MIGSREYSRFLKRASKAYSKFSPQERRYSSETSKVDSHFKTRPLAVRKVEIERLARVIREYRESHLLPIHPAWRNHRRLYQEKSPKLLIWDLETSGGSCPELGFQRIFQICVMNAAEEVIVYGTINQQMSVNSLYDMNKDIPLWENQCNKFYGSVRQNTRIGILFRNTIPGILFRWNIPSIPVFQYSWNTIPEYHVTFQAWS